MRRTVVGRTLDRLYLAGGAVSALCLVAIVVLIVMTWGARVLGITFSVGTEFAGYAMAAASFLAFAYTLNHSAHIRVTLGLNAMGRYRHWGEVWCFLLGAVITTWIAWEAVEYAFDNFTRGRRSSGASATPLWIPQLPMAVGAVLLAVCFWDNLVALLRRGRSNMVETGLDDGQEAQAEI